MLLPFDHGRRAAAVPADWRTLGPGGRRVASPKSAHARSGLLVHRTIIAVPYTQGRQDLNPRHTVLETAALARLSYTPKSGTVRAEHSRQRRGSHAAVRPVRVVLARVVPPSGRSTVPGVSPPPDWRRRCVPVGGSPYPWAGLVVREPWARPTTGDRFPGLPDCAGRMGFTLLVRTGRRPGSCVSRQGACPQP